MYKQYDNAIKYWKRAFYHAQRADDKDSDAAKKFIYATKYNIACAYAYIRDENKSILWLNKSLKRNKEYRLNLIFTDHDLDMVRDTLEFKKFSSTLKM